MMIYSVQSWITSSTVLCEYTYYLLGSYLSNLQLSMKNKIRMQGLRLGFYRTLSTLSPFSAPSRAAGGAIICEVNKYYNVPSQRNWVHLSKFDFESSIMTIKDC
jgi:hypothetical protein